jgi:hypothetical protein
VYLVRLSKNREYHFRLFGWGGNGWLAVPIGSGRISIVLDRDSLRQLRFPGFLYSLFLANRRRILASLLRPQRLQVILVQYIALSATTHKDTSL